MLQSVLHFINGTYDIINKTIINSPLTRINTLMLCIPMTYFLKNGAPIIITNITATKKNISIYPISHKLGNVPGTSSDHKYLASIVATANTIIMVTININ